MESRWSDTIIDGLYRTFLRREPDSGRDYHTSILKHHGSSGISAVFDEFLHSPEFQRRQLDSLALPQFRHNHKFKHTVSLGTHCYTSFLLKYAGLKAASYPFDWIFSSPAMILHCLSDDFREFSRAENFLRVPDARRRHGAHYNLYDNIFYRNSYGVESVFNHHDMSDDRNLDYFRRCINRFRALNNAKEKTLFVQCAPESGENFDLFGQTCEVIDRLNSSSTFLLVTVTKPRSRAVMPDVALQSERGRHQYFQLTPTSAWRGISFDALIDDLAVLRIIERQGLDVERKFSPWATL